MLKEVIMFTVVCDNCGKDSGSNSEYSAWGDKEYALECAMNSEWIEDNDEHYCPYCYSYDDEDILKIG